MNLSWRPASVARVRPEDLPTTRKLIVNFLEFAQSTRGIQSRIERGPGCVVEIHFGGEPRAISPSSEEAIQSLALLTVIFEVTSQCLHTRYPPQCDSVQVRDVNFTHLLLRQREN